MWFLHFSVLPQSVCARACVRASFVSACERPFVKCSDGHLIFLHLLFCCFKFLFISSSFAIFNIFPSAYFTNSFLFYSGHTFLFMFLCECVN